GVILALREVVRTEELRQTDDRGASGRCVAHTADRRVEVGAGIGRAPHLDEADPDAGGRWHRRERAGPGPGCQSNGWRRGDRLAKNPAWISPTRPRRKRSAP